MHTNTQQIDVWYRNPWVWLVIAIPSLTVAGCMLTIYLALTNPHTLVSDAIDEEPAATHAGAVESE